MTQFFNIATLCLAAGLTFLSVSAPARAEGENALTLSRDKYETLGIETVRPETADMVWSMAYPSEVVIPNNQVNIITSLYPGLIKALHVAEGDRVRRGQKLAEIASPAFLEAQRQYLDAAAALDREQNKFARDKLLLDDGIISEKRFQITRAELYQAENTHAQQKQALIFAGLDEATIRRLDKERQLAAALSLAAPFDGVILQQIAQTGQTIDESAGLYRLARVSPLWLEIHVPVTERHRFSLGGKARIEPLSLEGEIIAIGHMVHEADQGLLVRAEIRDGAEKLIPGQFAPAQLQRNGDGRVGLRLPQQALFRQAGETYVFRQTESGFQAVPVTLISEEQNAVIIEGPLGTEDRIAVRGIAALKGMWLGLGSEE